MDKLRQRIKKDACVLNEQVLKVDSFITHQIDPQLMEEIGIYFAQLFSNQPLTKIITIEASGIAPAVFVAKALNIPLVFARKSKSLTMDEELLTTPIYSFTKQQTSQVSISKKFLSSTDKVVIIDDFLANGQAAKGLVTLCQEAGAEVCGVGVLIEKSFQGGRKLLEDMGLCVISLARIASLSGNEVEFYET